MSEAERPNLQPVSERRKDDYDRILGKSDLSTLRELFYANPTFDAYQTLAFSTAVYPHKGEGCILYPALGLFNEAGEILEKIQRGGRFAGIVADFLTTARYLARASGCLKKAYRDDGSQLGGFRLSDFRQCLQIVMATCKKLLADLPEAATGETVYVNLMHDGSFSIEALEGINREYRDVGWYWAGGTYECQALFAGMTDHGDFNFNLSFVATANIRDLAGRQERGTLHGDGDNR